VLLNRIRLFVGKEQLGDVCLALLLTLLALGARLPYWQTIPAAGDEINQAIYALQIVRGHGYPLVGNDAYAGPFYFYLLALLFRLGVTDPFVGRAVALITGALMVPLTYAWVRQMRGPRSMAVVAGLLVAANPHLILLNSHVGGTTLLLPFLTLIFLWSLARAIYTDHRGWLITSAVLAGLVIQSNAVGGLAIAGGWAWAALRARRSHRLGKHWPLWSLIGVLCVALVYSPVIAHNLNSDLASLDVVQQRSYLWEENPTARTFFNNETRLILQLVRQTSGVLMGDETLRTILGFPLLYLVWAVIGVAHATRRFSALPAMVLAPFLLVLPTFSSHYGMIDPMRFTSLLTPVLAACMGFAFATLWKRISRAGQSTSRWAPVAICVLVGALALYPLVLLFQYYDSIEKRHLSGRALLDLSRQIATAHQEGGRVYIGFDDHIMAVAGMPYVPRAYLVFADVYQDFLPAEGIVGQLFEFSGPVTLILSDKSATAIQQVAPLVPWPSAANKEAGWLGYGAYTLKPGVPLVKPDFVLEGSDALNAAPEIEVDRLIDGNVHLIGYDAPTRGAPREMLTLRLYWQAVESMPPGTYIGFVHLYDSATDTLIAQNDHVLGQELYPINAWQPNEVIVDAYSLHVPPDVTLGEYSLRVGVYTWPDLIRLDVPEHPDDIIELGSIIVDQ
jgi:hypothetical protein